MSVDPKQFAVSVLQGLGAPVTHANVGALVGWANAEGGAVHNNPYNTTQSAPGATSMNSVGVKTYTGYHEALHATIETLKNGYYGHIIDALKSSNPNAFVAAVGSSPWGTTGSLLQSTVHDALGQSYGLTPAEKAGSAKVAGAKINTGTVAKVNPGTPPSTSISQTGGKVDTARALGDAIMSTPISINVKTGDTSGIGSSDYLSKATQLIASGAYTTPVATTITKNSGVPASVARMKISQAVGDKAVVDAASAGANASAQKLLRMLHNANGGPYNQDYHDAVNAHAGSIRTNGTDCSGLISWLMGPHGLGIWSQSLATPSIGSAPGLKPGKGGTITVWNNDQAGNAGHVFIQIGNQFWASEGGGVGVGQISKAEADGYIAHGSDGGTYKPYHPKGD